MLRFWFLTALLLGIALETTSAQSITPPRPDDYAPASIILDRLEPIGRLTAGYRFAFDAMGGHRDGSRKISNTEMLSTSGSNFRVIPTRMPSQTHTFSISYGVTDRIAVLAELPLFIRQMTLMERDSTTYRLQSSGAGNFEVLGLYRLYDNGPHEVLVHAGFSLATGSTEKRDTTPDSSPESIKLPYAMQTGSGTADFLPGLSYKGRALPFSWGMVMRGVLRGGDNDHSYRFGNYFGFSAWGAYRLDPKTSLSFSMNSESQGEIEGGDPAYSIDVNARNVPTVFPEFQGYSRLAAGFGFNTYIWNGSFAGFRVGMELVVPVYQNVSGPQLEQDVSLHASLRYVLL